MDTYNLPNAQFNYTPGIYSWIEESVYTPDKTVYNIIVYYNGVYIDKFENVLYNTISLTFKGFTYLRGRIQELPTQDLFETKYYEKYSIRRNKE